MSRAAGLLIIVLAFSLMPAAPREASELARFTPAPDPALLSGPLAPSAEPSLGSVTRDVVSAIEGTAAPSPRTTGTASWYSDGPGLYAAVNSYRWGDRKYHVKVCRVGYSRCVVVLVRDFCLCGRGRVIDLSPTAFARLAPLSAGLVRVSVVGVDAGVPLPPNTDTLP